jgi:hypothetical protein
MNLELFFFANSKNILHSSEFKKKVSIGLSLLNVGDGIPAR